MRFKVRGKASSELGNLQSGSGVGEASYQNSSKYRGSGWLWFDASLAVTHVSRVILYYVTIA
jgi:hypothetical protein